MNTPAAAGILISCFGARCFKAVYSQRRRATIPGYRSDLPLNICKYCQESAQQYERFIPKDIEVRGRVPPLRSEAVVRAQYRLSAALPHFSDAPGSPRINRGPRPRGNGAGGFAHSRQRVVRDFRGDVFADVVDYDPVLVLYQRQQEACKRCLWLPSSSVAASVPIGDG